MQTSFSTFVLSLSCHLFLPLFSSFFLSFFYSYSSSSPHISFLVSSSSPLYLSLHPKVQLQVHVGHYNPAERYSPPLRPHLSLSSSLSFSESSFSLIINSPERQIIALVSLSLYVCSFFLSSSVPHLFSLTPSFLFINVFVLFLLNSYLYSPHFLLYLLPLQRRYGHSLTKQGNMGNIISCITNLDGCFFGEDRPIYRQGKAMHVYLNSTFQQGNTKCFT